MLNIYKKIKRDFSLLSKYEYIFDHDEHHYVMPSVVFRKNDKKIQIGMHYEDNKMFILYYTKKDQLLGKNIIENLNFQSGKYEEHVDKVKPILIDFLQRNEIN